MNPIISYYVAAEMDYRRERLNRDLSRNRRLGRGLGGRLGRHHRESLHVVQPYGDVRA